MDIQNIQDNLAKHLSEGQKRKLTLGIAILGDPQVSVIMRGEECGLNISEKSSPFTTKRSRAFTVMYKERTFSV